MTSKVYRLDDYRKAAPKTSTPDMQVREGLPRTCDLWVNTESTEVPNVGTWLQTMKDRASERGLCFGMLANAYMEPNREGVWEIRFVIVLERASPEAIHSMTTGGVRIV